MVWFRPSTPNLWGYNRELLGIQLPADKKKANICSNQDQSRVIFISFTFVLLQQG